MLWTAGPSWSDAHLLGMALLKHVHHMVCHISIRRIARACGQCMPLHRERCKLSQAHGRLSFGARLGGLFAVRQKERVIGRQDCLVSCACQDRLRGSLQSSVSVRLGGFFTARQQAGMRAEGSTARLQV